MMLADAQVQTNFVAGWGTLTLVNAGLAQSKDRSGLLWWFFSLLLGPVELGDVISDCDIEIPESPVDFAQAQVYTIEQMPGAAVEIPPIVSRP